ncbi:unnamed protein product [Ixodes persulcatus]
MAVGGEMGCIPYTCPCGHRARATSDGGAQRQRQNLRGSVVLVRWSAEEPPAEAMLIEAGDVVTTVQMEVLQADNTALKKGNATLQEENAALRMENERLQHALRELEAVIVMSDIISDTTSMVKRLHRVLRAQEADQVRQVDQAAVVPAAMTDIGCVVLVESSTLQVLRKAAKSSGCKFARSLLKVLFPNDSWKEKSLHGRKSNAHKDIEAKEALDPTIVKALLGYTCTEFDVTLTALTNSLSSMLARGV